MIFCISNKKFFKDANTNFDEDKRNDYIIYRSIIEKSLIDSQNEQMRLEMEIMSLNEKISKAKAAILKAEKREKLCLKKRAIVNNAIEKGIVLDFSEEELLKIQIEKKRISETKDSGKNAVISLLPVNTSSIENVDFTNDKKFFFDTEVTIGREEICDFVIPDSTVSRKHARIFKVNDSYYIEDLNSKNGVIINKKKISKSEPILLENLTTIILGSSKIVFYLNDKQN